MSYKNGTKVVIINAFCLMYFFFKKEVKFGFDLKEVHILSLTKQKNTDDMLTYFIFHCHHPQIPVYFLGLIIYYILWKALDINYLTLFSKRTL